MQPPEPHLEPTDMLGRLGEDLLLLSIRPDNGKVATARRIDYGLMGSELVRLAASGRIDVAEDRIVVRDRADTGDAELDAALRSIAGAKRPPRAESWVGLPRHGIRNAYLARLVSGGVLRAEPSALLGIRRYRVAAPERVAQARSRLDAIARSAGHRLEVSQTAFGGLACAIDLDNVLYPGRAGRPLRARLAQIAQAETISGARSAGIGSGGAKSGREPVQPDSRADGGTAGEAAVDAALQVAADAALETATDAAAQAGTSAATSATIHATTSAAVHAATSAAVHAATSAAVHAATSAAVNGAHTAGGHSDNGQLAGLHGTGGHGDGGGHQGGSGGHH